MWVVLTVSERCKWSLSWIPRATMHRNDISSALFAQLCRFGNLWADLNLIPVCVESRSTWYTTAAKLGSRATESASLRDDLWSLHQVASSLAAKQHLGAWRHWCNSLTWIFRIPLRSKAWQEWARQLEANRENTKTNFPVGRRLISGLVPHHYKSYSWDLSVNRIRATDIPPPLPTLWPACCLRSGTLMPLGNFALGNLSHSDLSALPWDY